MAGTTEVVSVDGALFYHAGEPVTVGGPFVSVEALVRSEGWLSRVAALEWNRGSRR